MTRVRWRRMSTVTRFITAVITVAVVAAGGVTMSSGPAAAAPIRSMQWHLNALQIPEAHKITKGAGVIVAVIDSGVDATHRDLAGQVLPGIDLGTRGGGDGRIDRDSIGHGTHMAGIIAAAGGGAEHALGIAPEAKILPVAITMPGASPEIIATAIRWSVDHGADVINMSFGVTGSDIHIRYRPVFDAVKYALDHDVVLVSASGNTDSKTGVTYSPNDVTTPADIPGVIAVGATTQSARHLPTSVYGPEVVLSAPGDQIASTAIRAVAASGYAYGGHTSGASAIVSGAAALVRARFPDMDAKNVVNRLIATAKDQGVAGRDPQFGFGTVRPLRALRDDVPTVNAWPIPTLGPSATEVPVAGGSSGASSSKAGAAGSGRSAMTWIIGALCVVATLVVTTVVAVIIAVVRRNRRRRAPDA